MKYKSIRYAHRFISVIGLGMGLLSILTMVFLMPEYNMDMLPLFVLMAILGISAFIYCWTDLPIRNQFIKNGVRHEAKLVGAEHLFNARGEDIYFLIIEFFADGKKLLRRTDGYVGNPNENLSSKYCAVYEWKGKYMEAELKGVDNKLHTYCIPPNAQVPITKYHPFKLKNKKYV